MVRNRTYERLLGRVVVPGGGNRMDNLVDGAELNRVIENGDIPFFLTVSYLYEMDFPL